MHKELESALCNYLGVEHISLFANGTLALVTALQALKVSGEVITTPYSFVATAHALLWNGIKPVFVDIDPDTLNLDCRKIEGAITSETSAIMPVHCYGNPCDVDEIHRIADNYNLEVIYDAAHAFGVKDSGGSILRHGDLSILSFHATKVFNTFEGGAIVCPDAKTKDRIDRLKNFGFVDEVTVVAAGINGKMSEINAAFGLLQLDHVDAAVSRRRAVDAQYMNRLQEVKGVRFPAWPETIVRNHSYFPVLITPEFRCSRDELYEGLKGSGILARRYFYPLIAEFPMYRSLPSANVLNLPVALDISRQIICLPMHPNLCDEDVDRVCDFIVG